MDRSEDFLCSLSSKSSLIVKNDKIHFAKSYTKFATFLLILLTLPENCFHSIDPEHKILLSDSNIRLLLITMAYNYHSFLEKLLNELHSHIKQLMLKKPNSIGCIVYALTEQLITRVDLS